MSSFDSKASPDSFCGKNTASDTAARLSATRTSVFFTISGRNICVFRCGKLIAPVKKVFVDYRGKTVSIINSIINAATDEISEAQIFVALLGAFNYTFAEVAVSQKMEDLIGSHNPCFRSSTGVLSQLVVPYNLKAAVTRSCRYKPLHNQTYAELLQLLQYGSGCRRVPTNRAIKRMSKSPSVWLRALILTRLRHWQFFSLFE